MRYAQRGGYTPRRAGAARTAEDAGGRAVRARESIEAVAEEFRVTVPTVRRWRRQWREDGTQALRSKGPVSVERLSARQWV
ncbi:helix-turn-helix domain-containing protein [Streptomyces sp. NPDC001601]|uniref:helix-turn-helix domain-containing protein n=1 Tax=Streptomyces sp. NPDC001601 TaxID=3364592 RepID=UPI003676F23B